MKIEAGKPRVIRRKREGKTDKTTTATDKRTGFRLRKGNGQKQHVCYGPCPWPGRVIEPGPYIAVTHPDWGKRIGHRYVPTEFEYHPDCVPHEARPLVRFLIPTPWVMTLCEGSDQKIKSWRFTSVEAWRAAMDKHHPMMSKRYHSDMESGRLSYQVGTNYHWSQLFYAPRPWE